MTGNFPTMLSLARSSGEPQRSAYRPGLRPRGGHRAPAPAPAADGAAGLRADAAFRACGDRRPSSARRARLGCRARVHRRGRERHAGRLRLHDGSPRSCRGLGPIRSAGATGPFASKPGGVRQTLRAWAEGARPFARPAPPPRDRSRQAGAMGDRGGAAPARGPGRRRLARRQARSQGEPASADRRRGLGRPASPVAPPASRRGERRHDPLADRRRARFPRPLRLLRALAMAACARALPQRAAG
jgi:hypothetical protein